MRNGDLVTLTDIPEPPCKATWLDTLKQFVPPYNEGDLVADVSMLPEGLRAWALARGWYGRIAVSTENNRAWELEAVHVPNVIRGIMRRGQAWVCFVDRVCHGIYGVGSELSSSDVPTYKPYNYNVAGVTQVADGLVDVSAVWDGSADTDPRAVSSSRKVDNPDWVPGDPDETRKIDEVTTFALPDWGVGSFTAPSLMKLKPGLVCYRIGDNAQTVEPGGTFTFHCFGSSWGRELEEFPEDDLAGQPVQWTYRFYPAHLQEQWQRTRDAYPFMGVPETITISAPTASVYTLLEAGRCWPGAGKGKARGTLTMPDASTRSFDPRPWLRIAQLVGGYVTTLDLTGADLGGAVSLELVIWREAGESDTGALLLGQNRCANSAENWAGSWGTPGENGCKHFCTNRLTATGAGSFRAGNNVTGGCLLAGTCDQFTMAGGDPDWPLAASLDLQTAHPWKEEQIMAGDTATIFSRLKHGSPASECGLMTLLAGGKHVLKKYEHATRGACQMRSEGNIVHRDFGYRWLMQLDKQPYDLTNDATLPPRGPGAGSESWTKDAEFGAAPDRAGIMAGMLTESDVEAPAYRIDSGWTSYLGQYLRMRAKTALFWDLPASDKRAYLDGVVERGSWTFGAVEYTYLIRLRPFSFARGQVGWTGGGHTAKIVAAELVDGGVKLYLENVQIGCTVFEGGETEVGLAWKQGGQHVETHEAVRVWNYQCDDTRLGTGRNKIHAGMRARIVDDAELQGAWVVDAQAFDPDGPTQSWKTDAGDARSESEYYEQVVARAVPRTIVTPYEVSGSLPAGHEARANKPDSVLVLDAGGEWSGKGAEWFVGKTLTCDHLGVCAADGFAVEAKDALEEGATLVWRLEAADGVLYIGGVQASNTVAVTGTFADRGGFMLADAVAAHGAAIEKMLS